MEKKSSIRKTGIFVGLLFLISTLTFMTGSNLIKSFLTDITQNISTLWIGVTLEILCGISVASIGVLMFPLLKVFNRGIALGYVIFRIIECTAIVAGGIYLLSRLKLMWKYEMIVFIFTALGGLIFSYLLFISKLVPRSLSGLGIFGYLLLFLGVILSVFNALNVNEGAGMLIYLPGGLYELFLPVWLFIKGFNQSGFNTERA